MNQRVPRGRVFLFEGERIDRGAIGQVELAGCAAASPDDVR